MSMTNLPEQWIIYNPETFKKLREMRAEIRKETGEDVHFSDESSIRELLELCLQSKNPRMKLMAADLKKKLDDQLLS